MKPVRARFSQHGELYQAIYNVLGFYPRNIHLYELALRHKSVAPTMKNGIRDSNERLEYLGDAVLSTVIADLLFRRFPFKDEGFLTEMRSRMVSRSQLNKLSVKMGIASLVKTEADENNQSRSLAGDAFEAVIGAIYLDRGFNFTRKIIVNNIISVHLDLEEIENTDHNFKSRLVEWAQKNHKALEFSLAGESGQGKNKHYLVNIVVDSEIIAQGEDFSIKGAEQNAASKACDILGIIGRNKTNEEIVV